MSHEAEIQLGSNVVQPRRLTSTCVQLRNLQPRTTSCVDGVPSRMLTAKPCAFSNCTSSTSCHGRCCCCKCAAGGAAQPEATHREASELLAVEEVARIAALHNLGDIAAASQHNARRWLLHHHASRDVGSCSFRSEVALTPWCGGWRWPWRRAQLPGWRPSCRLGCLGRRRTPTRRRRRVSG